MDGTTPLPAQLQGDQEYRPETEPQRKRKALLKELNDARVTAGRLKGLSISLEEKFKRIEVGLLELS